VRYKVWRSNKDKSLHLLCGEGRRVMAERVAPRVGLCPSFNIAALLALYQMDNARFPPMRRGPHGVIRV